MKTRFTKRSALTLLLIGAGVSLLAGCQPKLLRTLPAATADSSSSGGGGGGGGGLSGGPASGHRRGHRLRHHDRLFRVLQPPSPRRASPGGGVRGDPTSRSGTDLNGSRTA